MSWVIQTDGVNDYLSITQVGLVGDFKLVFTDFRFIGDPAVGFGAIIGRVSASNNFFITRDTDKWQLRINGVDANFTFVNVPPSQTRETLTIERIGSNATLTFGGNNSTVACGTGTFDFDGFGRVNTTLLKDIEYGIIEAFDSTSTLIHKWDATPSNHGSGTPLLLDTVGSNDATGVNMPTDGSAWVDLGGGGISVTGTAVPTQTEADIVTGGKTIILTLSGDTFVTGTSSEDGIAGGSDSDIAASGTNWDSLIKTALDNTDVALSVGDTVATITLPAFATYDIPATETITWTIPAASLTTSATPVIATPTHTVTAVVAGVTGTITQTTASFTQSAIGTVVLNITGSITQSVSSFTQSANGTVSSNITGTITQATGAFTQLANGLVAQDVTGVITQTISSFTQSATGIVPLNIPVSDGLLGNQSLGNGIVTTASFGPGLTGKGSL